MAKPSTIADKYFRAVVPQRIQAGGASGSCGLVSVASGSTASISLGVRSTPSPLLSTTEKVEMCQSEGVNKPVSYIHRIVQSSHREPGAEKFHSFREVHTLEWHMNRQAVGQTFLDHFVRQVRQLMRGYMPTDLTPPSEYCRDR